MLRCRAVVALVGLSTVLISLGATAHARDIGAARRGADFIVSKQLPSGSFFSENNPADGVAEALAAISAVGAPRSSIDSALSYLRDRARERASRQGGYAGRVIMGLVAAGADPSSFGGFDYVELLESFYDPGSGAYDPSTVYADALGVLGVAAGGRTPPPKAIEYLRRQECPAGGFSHQTNCTQLPDSDTTGIVLNALLSAGVSKSDSIVSRTLSFLRSNQNEDGGFGAQPYSLDNPTNANSTGLVVSGIVAAGEDPATWSKGQGDPISALLGLQTATGGFKYTAANSQAQDYATVQAIPAVASLAYPLTGTSMAPPVKGGDSATAVRGISTNRTPTTAASPRTASLSSPEPEGVIESQTVSPAGHNRPDAKASATSSQDRSPAWWLIIVLPVLLSLPLIMWRRRLR